jgi:leader peptidase (prepilin peptidase)/N-methyltransferase
MHFSPSLLITLDVAAIAFGLILGSFFNVVIWRLPRQESIVLPPSKCPSCARPIKPWENIPVLSYLFLRGRCAGCRQPISPRYLLVELLTATLAFALWKWFALPGLAAVQGWWAAIPLALECAALLVLIPVAFIDLEHYVIPDSITLPGAALGIGVAFIPGGVTPLEMVLGLAAGGGFLLAVGFVSGLILKKESMGGGDIKLMAMIGALFGWKLTLLTLMFGSFLGAAVGVAMIRWLPKDHRIPFGPFLAAGLWIALFAGNRLVGWYLGLASQ